MRNMKTRTLSAYAVRLQKAGFTEEAQKMQAQVSKILDTRKRNPLHKIDSQLSPEVNDLISKAQSITSLL